MEIFTSRSRHPKTLEIDLETGKKKRQMRSLNSELLPLTNQSGFGKSSLDLLYHGFI